MRRTEEIAVGVAAVAMLVAVTVATVPAGAQDPPMCNGREATIVGTAGDDRLFGTEGNDVIVGGDGDDVIRAFGGNDFICGDDGRDRLFGGRGNDTLLGGKRNDILKGDQGRDHLLGNQGRDRLIGGGGVRTGGSFPVSDAQTSPPISSPTRFARVSLISTIEPPEKNERPSG